ncbi:transposase [Komagataeibacter intermedius AF2]|uniref:Transposase n=1 Tax=Komagataeibacter intermedius AF2 TaxID=1458464 RepID=A0A0C1RYE7_9PROT|nr:transposase [Komagataeibacter intermedius AF2]KPH88009.1 transposase [Komagataeibacter intermedius AF2]
MFVICSGAVTNVNPFWKSGCDPNGVVSIDGTKIDADASKYRSLRYDRIRTLREHLAVDIAKLMSRRSTQMPQTAIRRHCRKSSPDGKH